MFPPLPHRLGHQGALLAALLPLALLLTACPKNPSEPAAPAGPYQENFDRAELGPEWLATASSYRLVDGTLRLEKAYNHPIWLLRKLPRDVVIELDVVSYSPAG